MLIAVMLGLTACQAPYNRNVYHATRPRVHVKYWDSFKDSAPQQVQNKTMKKKNNYQMEYAAPVYVPYQQPSLSRSVYGTM